MAKYNRENKDKIAKRPSRSREKQNHLCAICGKAETMKHKDGRVKPLCVDHCHTTDKIRGLLCGRCNSGIGMLKDDISIVESALNYLKSHK